LVDLVKTEGITEAEAEAKTLAFIASWVDKGVSPLCGNSIGQDRRFLVKYMPKLEAHLHYRNLDVSTVKELAVRWRPDVSEGVVKEGAHRAINDVKDSIAELRHYRDNFFSLN
jgi:oligoribonuclease